MGGTWGGEGRRREGKGKGEDVRKLNNQFEQVERAFAFARVLMGLISAG